MSENYYTILEVEETASYEEIKRAYQKLVKLHHPDKQNDFKTSELYEKIDEAWRVLRDFELKKEYDAKLMNEKIDQNVLLYATLNINELDKREDGMFSYNCRCGGLYLVQPDFQENECFVISCDECSLLIKIKK